jgi:hypothetical protein
VKSLLFCILFSVNAMATTTTTTLEKNKPLIDDIDANLVTARKNVKGALSDLEDGANAAGKKIQKAIHGDKNSEKEKEVKK